MNERDPLQLAIIADDVTGACDTAACFAGNGLKTFVALATEQLAGPLPPAQVVAVTTESRHGSADAAIEATRRAAEAILSQGRPGLIYKKMDSTLRGHAGPELRAVAQVCGAGRMLVAPAFPDQGRTTVNGRQCVHGRPLELTSLPALFGPYAAGCVRALSLAQVRAGEDALAQLMAQTEPALFVADAETNDDLAALAGAAWRAGLTLLCGSAGLARAVAARMQTGRPPKGVARHVRGDGPVLIVAGSQHSATAGQVDDAGQCGMLVLRVAQDGVLPADRRALVADAATSLTNGRPVVLSMVGSQPCAQGPGGVARFLAETANDILSRASVAGVVLTGGDIAAAACSAFGARWIGLDGEVVPGIPIGRLADGPYAGLGLVTKAGGFGQPDALTLAARALALRG
jgi:uncharacterized protein YgbK (DUF1537 family)